MNYEETAPQKQTEEKVIDKILKQLTPENTQKQIKEIQAIELPLELQEWIEEYEKVGEREGFLWNWVYKATQITTLPVVLEQYRAQVSQIKTLLVMFDSLLDDVADKQKNGRLLNELVKIPFRQSEIRLNSLNFQEKQYLELTKKLWEHIKTSVEKYPKYQEFKEVFKYDINQLLNTMEYAYLINKNPYLINEKEHWPHLSPNMSTMICYTIDLMCSLFDIKKLRILRMVGWEAQKMARIGNWISTWEREIKEEDFTSGVLPYALKSGLINIEDLQKENKEEIIKRIQNGGIEDYLLQQWEQSFNRVKKYTESNDLANMEKGLEQLMIMHLISKGYK